ncbi:prophage tail fiber N-terminal domain-containing protein [Aeromonas enteropelogenes]|uniref:prophage tail fiber N-terminal domain-containing protein n=1 Tax=Aeromonas enteropelogenes TaxID=29489 RepID=UPI003BA0C971
MIKLFGVMTDPAGLPVPNALLEFRAINSTKEALFGGVVTYKCDAAGRYDLNLALGHYDVYAQSDYCSDMDYLGTAAVTEATEDGDIYHILVDGGVDITPPIVAIVIDGAARAEAAAVAAEESAASASESAEIASDSAESVLGTVVIVEGAAAQAKASAEQAETAAGSASEDAARAETAADSAASNFESIGLLAHAVQENTDVVAADAEEVARLAALVASQATQVTEDAQQVAGDLAQVGALVELADQAADTASQKAEDAAASQAAAEDAADRAEAAALSNTGAILDGGICDLSGGSYPAPITVAGSPHSTVWYVAVAGVVDGDAYEVGDILRFTTVDGGHYFRVDTKESVYSVNGEKGVVTVTPEKIGAEQAGVAADLVQQHANAPDAHPMANITGLPEALGGKADVEHTHDVEDIEGLDDVIFNEKDYKPRRDALGTFLVGDFINNVDAFALTPGTYGRYMVSTTRNLPEELVAGGAGSVYLECMATFTNGNFGLVFLYPISTSHPAYFAYVNLYAHSSSGGWHKIYDSLSPPTAEECGAAPAGHAHNAVDVQAASYRCNFAASLGVARSISGETLPSTPGVWAVNNSTWTPHNYGSLLVTTNRSDESVTPGTDTFIHYIFVSHRAARMYAATNVNESFSGWNAIYDTGHKPIPSEIGAAPTTHTHSAAQGNADIIAGSWNAVGATVMARRTGSAACASGERVAGSALLISSASASAGGALPGTWQCQGIAVANSGFVEPQVTNWIRVA